MVAIVSDKEKVYRAEKPCAKGHEPVRYISTRRCVVCTAIRTKKYKEANRKKYSEYAAKYRKANPEKVKESQKKYCTNNAEFIKLRRQQRENLPEPSHAAPENCECCDRPVWLFSTAFHLDHCHETGEFRGWLCNSCNRGIGYLGDNLDGLLKAVAYLRRKL